MIWFLPSQTLGMLISNAVEFCFSMSFVVSRWFDIFATHERDNLTISLGVKGASDTTKPEISTPAKEILIFQDIYIFNIQG